MQTSLFHSSRIAALVATIVLTPCLALAAGSPSELLEKGIYNEETKGDVEGAIAIYQQLVTEAKANEALAAQAQYRLATCLEKKNRKVEAIAAFEKLVAEYPNQKDYVAKARTHLPTALAFGPVPWPDGERLLMVLTVGSDTEIGAIELRADLAENNGRKVWRVGRLMSGGGLSVSSVDVDPETFQPIASYWKHQLIGEATAVFRPGEVEIQKTGSDEPLKLHPDKILYDNEECFHLPRRLPLAEGYKATVNVCPTLSGTVMPIEFEVVKRETLQVPAGKFDCFKVKLSIGQTLWYSTDEHRYLVKLEAGGATGSLAAISQHKAGTPVAFSDAALGISFTAPADWLVQRFNGGQPQKETLIRTYDSTANSTDGGLRLVPTDKLSAAARQSSRAWAESDLASQKDIKIRANSWKTFNVAGRVAAACTADYVESGKPQVQYFVHVLGPKRSEFFIISSAPEKFDALKAAFETVITSYRTTQ